MEDRVRRNCSAEPSGTSGLASWASWIFCFSSSVGIIVRIFWRWGQSGIRKGISDRSVSITYNTLFLFTIVCISHLYALLVERVLVKVKDGRLDGARRRKHRQTDVDGVAPLGIQNDDLLTLAVCCCFLGHKYTDRVSAGSPSFSLPVSFLCVVCFMGWWGLDGPSLRLHWLQLRELYGLWEQEMPLEVEPVQYACLRVCLHVCRHIVTVCKHMTSPRPSQAIKGRKL